jgi:ADP-ribosylglycohydrolase
MAAKRILGAIAGDFIGSSYEFNNVKSTDFTMFTARSELTDDSILTVATMGVLLFDGNYAAAYHSFGNKYPASYGGRFRAWLGSKTPRPYNSWGNGSAMRTSPIGWARGTLEEVLAEAEKSAVVTHNHPEGIKGAQAAAACVWMARQAPGKQETKDAIRAYVEKQFGYDLDRTCDQIRPGYSFDVSCQGSVPEAIIAFLESTDFENCVRLAVSLGGDSDTIAAIAGGIAEAFYGGVPEHIEAEVWRRLPPEFQSVVEKFGEKFI